jgi:type II secretory pathway component PulF
VINFSSLFKKTAKKSEYSTRKVARKGGLVERITLAADRMAFNWPVREALYRHLSAQIENTVPINEALERFQARMVRRNKPSSAKIVGDLSRRMLNGATLAEVLSTWVPQDECSVIASGELGGKLPRALDLIVETKRRLDRVNSALKASLVSPGIYLAAVYGMVWTIGRYVTPSLQQALPKERAQGMVYALYAAGDLANSWWALLPPIFLMGLVFAVVRSLPIWTGRHRVTAEKFFPYSFYRDIQGYAWLMSFSALLRTGAIADIEILKRQEQTATPWLNERLNAIRLRMNNGAFLADALLKKGNNGMPAFGFPNPDIVDDIGSMAGFSDFAPRIASVATQWAEELEVSTLRKAKSFGVAMEMLMYAVMGFLMIAINEMSTQIGSVGNIPGT